MSTTLVAGAGSEFGLYLSEQLSSIRPEGSISSLKLGNNHNNGSFDKLLRSREVESIVLTPLAINGSGMTQVGILLSATLALLDAACRQWFGQDQTIPGRVVQLVQAPITASFAVATEAAVTCYIDAYRQRHNLVATILRLPSVYGGRVTADGPVERLIHAALDGRRLPLYGDGATERRLIHAENAARALSELLDASDAAPSTTITPDVTVSERDLIGAICRAVDAWFHQHPDMIEHFPNAPRARGRQTASLVTLVRDRRAGLRHASAAADVPALNPSTRKPFERGLNELVGAIAHEKQRKQERTSKAA